MTRHWIKALGRKAQALASLAQAESDIANANKQKAAADAIYKEAVAKAGTAETGKADSATGTENAVAYAEKLVANAAAYQSSANAAKTAAQSLLDAANATLTANGYGHALDNGNSGVYDSASTGTQIIGYLDKNSTARPVYNGSILTTDEKGEIHIYKLVNNVVGYDKEVVDPTTKEAHYVTPTRRHVDLDYEFYEIQTDSKTDGSGETVTLSLLAEPFHIRVTSKGRIVGTFSGTDSHGNSFISAGNETRADGVISASLSIINHHGISLATGGAGRRWIYIISGILFVIAGSATWYFARKRKRRACR